MSAYHCNGGTLVPLTTVRATQSPLHTQQEKVDSMVGLMREGAEFARIQVRQEGGGFYRVLDGHHRTVASHQCSFTHIPVEIY